jgi:hypothetical protein
MIVFFSLELLWESLGCVMGSDCAWCMEHMVKTDGRTDGHTLSYYALFVDSGDSSARRCCRQPGDQVWFTVV